MSKPSFSNIDLWLFELAEGNLSADQIAQLELFLLQNPEFDLDRDAWQMAKVDADVVVYPDAVQLERRKPVGFYSAMGATFFILFTFVGCYQYFGIDSSAGLAVQNKGIAAKGTGTSQNDLMKEISLLKAELNEAKNENSNLLASVNRLEKEKNGNARIVIGKDGQPKEAQTAQLNVANGNDVNSATTNGNVNSNQDYLIGFNQNNANTSLTATTYFASNNSNEISSEMTLSKNNVNSGNVRTYPLRTIDYDWYSNRGPYARVESSKLKLGESAEMKLSLKAKMNKISRSLQRMMDNPIALKNSRDPHYHVPGLTTQDVSFGSSGTLLRTRVQTMSRIQWLGTENEQLMNQLAVDGYAYGIRGGLGIQMNHSMYRSGGIQVADVALTYSPKFSVSKWVSVEPAIRFKMGTKMLNHEQMQGVSAVEMERGNVFDYENPIGTNLWYKDLGLGVMVNTKWFFAGIQGDNLLRHQDNIYTNDLTSPRRAGTHFIATLGTDWESRKENMSLSPYMVYQQKEKLSEAWFGFNYRWGWFNVGGAISSNLDPAASIGLKFKQFSINYNADYTKSILTNQQSLSHQVSLRFLGKASRSGQRFLN